jgi:hypothetical protein
VELRPAPPYPSPQISANTSMNRDAAGAVSESGFQAAPTGIQALSSGPKSRKITSLAGIFCNGSLTTANPYPAATKASALGAPSASLTIRGLKPTRRQGYSENRYSVL